MKRRQILFLLAGCLLLMTPLQVQAMPISNLFAVAESEETGIETEIETGDTQEQEAAQDNMLRSVLNEMSVGSALVGADAFQEEATQEETAGEESSNSLSNILGASTVGSSVILECTKTEIEYAEAYEKAKNANWGYTNLGIADVESGNLNIRAVAAEDGKLVGKLPKNAACEVIDSDGTWAHIKSGEVEGYVSEEYLLTGIPAKRKAEELATTMARVTTDSLKVRAEANTDSEVITLVPNGERLEVIEVEGDWVKVGLDDQEVYVSAEYVEVSSELSTAITMTELLYGQGVSDVRVDLCQYAKEFLGNPYVWGGTSLTKGADCSGFVLSIFKKYGVSLPHSSRAQANCGTTIKVSEAQPGDLIFYGNGKTINHVAIYIGGGQVIHASSPKTGIRISNVSYRSPVKAVKVLYD
ncbi:MAG: NlpC/P60 family protein [Lachnospiraceae bacterium]|nr:NlpC/P60 family protein [Lachnospiraceae bacterium]